MPCPSDGQLNLYLDGELLSLEAKRLDVHVMGCASCQQALQQLDDADLLLQATLLRMPRVERGSGRIVPLRRAGSGRLRAARRRPASRSLAGPGWAVAASVLVGLGLLLVLSPWRSDPQPETAQPSVEPQEEGLPDVPPHPTGPVEAPIPPQPEVAQTDPAPQRPPFLPWEEGEEPAQTEDGPARPDPGQLARGEDPGRRDSLPEESGGGASQPRASGNGELVAERDAASQIQLMGWEGPLEVLRKGAAEWEPLALAAAAVGPDDTLRAAGGGVALSLSPGLDLALDKGGAISASVADQETLLTLHRGRLAARVLADGSDPLTLKAGAAQARVTGTLFTCQMHDARTEFRVYEGSLQVGERHLPAGRKLRLDAAGAVESEGSAGAVPGWAQSNLPDQRVLWGLDFERGDGGLRGHLDGQAYRGRVSLRADRLTGNEWWGACVLDTGTRFALPDRGRLYLRFALQLPEQGPFLLQVTNWSQSEKLYHYLWDRLGRTDGGWQQVIVPLDAFTPYTGEARLAPGDILSHLGLFAGKPDFPVFFRVDDLALVVKDW